MSTEPNFVLKWNNFGNVLSYNFYENLKSEKFCDVTLAVEGKFISAHKIILSASSQFFEEMFNLSTERQVIIMSDLKLKDVVNVLEFVYKGEITLGAEDLKSFMETAKVLSLRGIPKNTLENADDISIAPLTPPPSLHDSSEEEATSEANINVKNFVKLEDNSEMQLPETAYQANETLEMKPQSQKKRKRELDRTINPTELKKKVHLTPGTSICSFCECFYSVNTIKLHVKSCKLNPVRIIHKCSICSKELSRSDKLAAHMKTHTKHSLEAISKA